MSPQPTPLPPLPSPLSLHGAPFTAQHPTLLHFKNTASAWTYKSSLAITLDGAPYLTAVEESRREVVFRDERGEEVLRVVKRVRRWSGGVEYSGRVEGEKGEGREVWGVRVHRGMRGVGYNLTIFPAEGEEDAVLVENNVLGQEMGMLYRGNVLATMSMHEKWKHLRREDVLNVAAGMDVLLAVGMCFVRIDREEGDKAGATVANASAAGAVVTAVT